MAETKVRGPDGQIILVRHPEGASKDDIISYAQQQSKPAPGRQTPPPELRESVQVAGQPKGGSPLRAPEFLARGIKESILETAGGVPDIIATGMRKVGLPAPEEGYYTKSLKSGFDKFGRFVSAPLNTVSDFGPAQPTSTLERAAFGAGRGVGDAAAFMAPAAAISKLTKAGGLTSNVAKAIATQPVAQTVAGLTGGATTGVTDNPLLGLGVSLATPSLGNVARRVITPVPRQLNPVEADLAKQAKEMGIELTPGQETGSTALQTAESTLTQLPLAAKRQQAIYDAQRSAFNRSVLKTAGVDADLASPGIIDGAFKDLGRRFDRLVDRTELNMDRQFFDEVNEAVMKYGRRLSRDVKSSFKSYVDDIKKMADASDLPSGDRELSLLNASKQRVIIEGDAYKNIASDLRTASRQAQNNPALQDAYGGLIRALDGVMARSSSPKNAMAWKNIRNKYRNLKIIDKAVGGGSSADRVSGNIPFSGLRQAAKTADKSGYGRGRGELNRISRVGEFLASRIPDSGTARRNYMTSLLTGSTGAGLGMGMYDPVMGATTAATSLLSPYLAQRAISSRLGRGYLANQLAQPSPQQLRGLLGKIYLAQDGQN